MLFIEMRERPPEGESANTPPREPKKKMVPSGPRHQERPKAIPVESVTRSSWPPAIGSPVIRMIVASPPTIRRSSE